MKLKSEMYNKTGRIGPRKLSVKGLSVCVKIKPLFWICSCSLPIQTPDSLSMHVTSSTVTHNYTFTFSKILMIIIIISHTRTRTHTHTFQTNFFTQEIWASWCLRAKSRSRTACDVEIVELPLKNDFVKQIGGGEGRGGGEGDAGMIAWRSHG